MGKRHLFFQPKTAGSPVLLLFSFNKSFRKPLSTGRQCWHAKFSQSAVYLIYYNVFYYATCWKFKSKNLTPMGVMSKLYCLSEVWDLDQQPCYTCVWRGWCFMHLSDQWPWPWSLMWAFYFDREDPHLTLTPIRVLPWDLTKKPTLHKCSIHDFESLYYAKNEQKNVSHSPLLHKTIGKEWGASQACAIYVCDLDKESFAVNEKQSDTEFYFSLRFSPWPSGQFFTAKEWECLWLSGNWVV